MRAFISDIAKGLQVRTDLRFAIFKAFREAGIEFPFPAQDIFIRSLPADTSRRMSPSVSGAKAHSAPPHEQDAFETPDE